MKGTRHSEEQIMAFRLLFTPAPWILLSLTSHPPNFGSNGMTIPDLFLCEGLFLQSFLVRRNSFLTSSLLEVCLVKRRMAGTVQLFCQWDSTCTLL